MNVSKIESWAEGKSPLGTSVVCQRGRLEKGSNGMSKIFGSKSNQTPSRTEMKDVIATLIISGNESTRQSSRQLNWIIVQCIDHQQ